MYFFVAGLSLESLLKIDNGFIIEWFLFISSFVIFCIGIFNYFRHKKMILETKNTSAIIKWNIMGNEKRLDQRVLGHSIQNQCHGLGFRQNFPGNTSIHKDFRK